MLTNESRFPYSLLWICSHPKGTLHNTHTYTCDLLIMQIDFINIFDTLEIYFRYIGDIWAGFLKLI